MTQSSRSGSADYRSLDDAIRDGWSVSFAPGAAWWSDARDRHSYRVTAKKREYHVELAGRSLAELRRAVRMLRTVPRADVPFSRDWWDECRRATR